MAPALHRRKSSGADFRPDLNTTPIEAVFRKGAYDAAYSGFEGVDENGVPLLEWLQQRGVDEVDVVGIAADQCVRRTAEDAHARGPVHQGAGEPDRGRGGGFGRQKRPGQRCGPPASSWSGTVMGAPPDREHLLAAVERSPRAASAHDRAGWLALFTDDGRVEDPVGSQPHVGRQGADRALFA